MGALTKRNKSSIMALQETDFFGGGHVMEAVEKKSVEVVEEERVHNKTRTSLLSELVGKYMQLNDSNKANLFELLGVLLEDQRGRLKF